MRIFDAHADTISEILDHNKKLEENDLHIDLKRMSTYEEYTQVFAVFISPEYKNHGMDRACALIKKAQTEMLSCGISLCKSYSDWKTANSRVKAFLSLEGGEPIENVSDVEKLFRLGIRIIAPTWNFQNKIACGAMEEKDTGLSTFGRQVIGEMERLGIICDVSHLSEKSFWDIAAISKKPLIASHSDSFSVKKHRRNLTDRQFVAIKDTGGCVGINFYPPFLGDKIEDAILHIDRFLSLGGEDNIGLGSDFDGVDALPLGMAGCQDMEGFIKMLPYSTKIREKIAYKNFLRVLKAHNC